MKITESELMAAVRDAAKAAHDTSGFASRQEIQDALGISEDTAKARLRQLHRQGRLQVGFRMAPDITGRMNKIPTYKVTKGR